MPKDHRKPLTALPDGIPTTWRDFVRCRRDSVELEPGELDWLPNMTALTLSFEEGADGSTTLRLVGLGGILNIGIAVSIVDGHLVADTTNIPVPGSSADEWIDNFNADLQANGMQFSDVSVRGEKPHLSKERIATETDTVTTSVPTASQPPLAPPPPPAHITDPIPEPVVHQSPPTPPPAPPPAHVTDPIPEPVVVTEETQTDDRVSDVSIPHADQAALQAPYSPGAHLGVARRWAKWSGVGAMTAGAFVLSVAAFFIFVNDRDDPSPSTPPPGQETGAIGGQSSSVTTNEGSSPSQTEEASKPTTTPPGSADDESVSMGFDNIGDQEDSNTSQPIEPGQEIPGGDIKEVSHRIETNGTHTITFYLAGDGEQFTEPGTAWYDVIVSAEDSTGGMWQANAAWFSGQYTDRGIRVGPVEPGRVALPDGLVAITFLGPDSFEMNVDGGGEPLDLSTFAATIGVSVDDQTLWDSANGTAGPP